VEHDRVRRRRDECARPRLALPERLGGARAGRVGRGQLGDVAEQHGHAEGAGAHGHVVAAAARRPVGEQLRLLGVVARCHERTPERRVPHLGHRLVEARAEALRVVQAAHADGGRVEVQVPPLAVEHGHPVGAAVV
jgi:hypothetical protein